MKAIYGILNKLNGNQYVGSAKNFYKRKYEHLNSLRKNKHHSYYLQNAWNKYGEDLFEFIILEKLDQESDLLEKEQWWIDNSNSNYNILKIAGRVTGFKHSDKTKELLKDNNWKGIFGKDNPFSKKCFQYSLDGLFIKEWESISQVERELGLSNSLIVRCLKGKTKTAHKFQWFYDFKGDKIETILVKSCVDGIRNKKLFLELKQAKIDFPNYGPTELAAIMGYPYTTIRNAYYRYKDKL